MYIEGCEDGNIPFKHGRNIVIIPPIRKTRLRILDLHDLLVRHNLPQHHALRDREILLALHKRLELVVHALHERRVEGELERPAAEELAAVEARGDVEQAVEYRVGYHAAHVRERVQRKEVCEDGFCLFLGAVVEELRHYNGCVLGRWRRERDEEGLATVVCFVEFVHEGYDLRQCCWGEDEGACEDRVGLIVGLEGEFCYDAEVLACTADGPEEVCVGDF